MEDTLGKHLFALNAELLRQGEPKEFHHETDLTYWADLGIHTVEDFEKSWLVGDISDYSKMVNGVRSRNFDGLSIKDLEELRDYYVNALHCQQAEDEERELRFEREKVEAEAIFSEILHRDRSVTEGLMSELLTQSLEVA